MSKNNVSDILKKYQNQKSAPEKQENSSAQTPAALKKTQLDATELNTTQEDPVLLVPNVDENIPLPKNAADAMPELSTSEELAVRAATIQLIADLTNQVIEPTEEFAEDAKKLATEMMQNPQMKPSFATYPNETIAMLAGMVAQTNHAVVDDLAKLKMYVINGLIKQAEMAKSDKDKIAALKAIGEVDGVDAFKKRSEVTVKQQSIEEVEEELLDVLKSLRSKTIEGEVVKDE